MTAVSILGPNIGHGGEFDVHAAGCADITRNRRYTNAEPAWYVDVASRRDIVEAIYADMIYSDRADENPDEIWQQYDVDIHVFPCVDSLPLELPKVGKPCHRCGGEATGGMLLVPPDLCTKWLCPTCVGQVFGEGE